VLRPLLALVAALFPVHTTSVIGHSALGTPIRAVERGDRLARPVLVVGCIHGTECAGVPVVGRLGRVRLGSGIHLWLLPVLNPDGRRLGVRQNGRGVDLNRNFPTGWRPDGERWSTQYPGPRPFSEPESRAAARLIRRVRPCVTIWYHQHLDLVWAFGRSVGVARLYVRTTGMRLAVRRWLAGTAPHWQNAALDQRSFVVELPAGRLSRAAVRRHAAAILALARCG
jgi:protein MpaA